MAAAKSLHEKSVMHRLAPATGSSNADLIDALMGPTAFDHPVADVQLIETHISWLILAGDFAYKIKKPIKLDFLDFSTLEKRRQFCDEEIRLNSPWAPGIYLDVVAITTENGQSRFGGSGDVIEYAVRMQRFDQSLRLDHQLEAGRLSVQDMKELALNIAERHLQAPRVDSSRRDRILEQTRTLMLDNFSALDGVVDDETLESLRTWTNSELERHCELIEQRFDDGFVRDCHGDLHLGNLVRLPSGITTFDCIEFNADLRHIDVMADVAFLVMDLVERDRHDLASHFLNRYLESTGDYGGIAVLSLFFVYRCLVRAKVAVIRSAERETDDDASADIAEVTGYCEMAMRQASRRDPKLFVMHGLSGSGKTFVSGQLMAALPAVRVRSDIERKRLFGLAETASSHSAIGEGIYTVSASEAVYEALFATARTVLAAGHDVILDAAFTDRSSRQRCLSLAQELGYHTIIIDVTADEETMRKRLLQRAAKKDDPSEASIDVFEYQLREADPLSERERAITISCDNSVSPDIDALVSQSKRRCI
jgi:aminoglycoside phosphotransferase family enzyme/predicted kinase